MTTTITLLGSDFYYGSAGDVLGFGISTNRVGNIVAIGSPIAVNGAITNAGEVRVFQYIAPNWIQLGSTIQGTISDDQLGYIVSLSATGTRMAVAVPQNILSALTNGEVRVYDYSLGSWSVTSTKSPTGSPAGRDSFGKALALSSDGSTYIVGAQTSDPGPGADTGEAFVYDVATDAPKGLPLPGTAGGDLFGTAVAINKDGTIVAISAPGADVNRGQVSVYQYIGAAWVLKGSIINGSTDTSTFGNSIALSQTGIVLAIGNSDETTTAGQVTIYRFIADWTLLQTINGTASGENLGRNIALNDNGGIFALSSHFDVPVGPSDVGKVQLYKYSSGSWKTLGDPIIGTVAGGDIGLKNSLNDAGTILASGSPNYPPAPPADLDKGLARVYQITTTGSSDDNPIPNACDLINTVKQNLRLVRAQACIPNPCPIFSYEELQMRRKAETLKHRYNQNKLTKNQRWARAAKGSYVGCAPTGPISNMSTSSDVPGTPVVLTSDESVPLVGYKKVYTYSEGAGEYISYGGTSEPVQAGWSYMGEGITATVYAMTTYNNEVYIGGEFTSLGNSDAVNYVVKWNIATRTWFKYPNAFNNTILSILVDVGGNIYVGGKFTKLEDCPCGYIAMWDVSQEVWSLLGNFNANGVNNFVRAISFDSASNVYAGGDFTSASGIPAKRVAKWTPSTGTWSWVGKGFNKTVHAFAYIAPTLYAGGEFTTLGDGTGTYMKYVAQFNGTTWSAMNEGLRDKVYTMTVDDSTVYAAGEILLLSGHHVAWWNGSSWSGLSDVIPNFLVVYTITINSAVGALDGTLIGGGISGDDDEGRLYNNFVGSVWTEVDMAFGPVQASTIDNDATFRIGGGYTFLGKNNPFFSELTPSGWNLTNTGLNNTTYALLMDNNDTNLYAGGAFTNAGSNAGVGGIAKWTPLNANTSAGTWSPLLTGVSGTVHALAKDVYNNIYVGGTFSGASGNEDISGIGMWTGTAWADVSGGVGGPVYALATDNSANIYVGGEFNQVGQPPTDVSNIAKYDIYSQQWLDVSGGTDGPVYALVCDGSNNVYVGGDFIDVGIDGHKDLAHYISKYNPVSDNWEDVEPDPHIIESLTVNSFFATGPLTVKEGGTGLRITSAGEMEIHGLLDLSGGILSNSGTLSVKGDHAETGTNNTVRSLVIDNSNNLYVGGQFTEAGGQPNNSIAKWNTHQEHHFWSVLNNSLNCDVYALALDPSQNRLFVGGTFNSFNLNRVAYLNLDNDQFYLMDRGIDDRPDDTLFREGIKALAIDQNNIAFAGGDFLTAGGVVRPYIGQWKAAATPGMSIPSIPVIHCAEAEFPPGNFNAQVNVVAVDNTGTIFVGGEFQTADFEYVYFIAKWNGIRWIRLGEALNGFVNAIAFDSNNNLYAGGAFTGTHAPITLTNLNGIARFDGEDWFALDNGVVLGGVAAIVVDKTDNVYIGGDFASVGSVPVADTQNIAKWDGTAWVSLGTGGANDIVKTLTFDSNDNLIAGGSFTNIGGASASRIAIYTGSWSELGTSGLPADVNTVITVGTDVYAGGYFNSPTYIAKLIGGLGAWTSIGLIAGSTINTIFSEGTDLYVGGDFSGAAGVSDTQNIAKYDGTTWSSLGPTGTTDAVMSINYHDNILYVGGLFNGVGSFLGQTTDYFGSLASP